MSKIISEIKSKIWHVPILILSNQSVPVTLQMVTLVQWERRWVGEDNEGKGCSWGRYKKSQGHSCYCCECWGPMALEEGSHSAQWKAHHHQNSEPQTWKLLETRNKESFLVWRPGDWGSHPIKRFCVKNHVMWYLCGHVMGFRIVLVADCQSFWSPLIAHSLWHKGMTHTGAKMLVDQKT